MTIVINDKNGHYIKTWHNWNDNAIPIVGDFLVVHFGDNCDETVELEVIGRVFSGTSPDCVYLTTDCECDEEM